MIQNSNTVPSKQNFGSLIVGKKLLNNLEQSNKVVKGIAKKTLGQAYREQVDNATHNLHVSLGPDNRLVVYTRRLDEERLKGGTENLAISSGIIEKVAKKLNIKIPEFIQNSIIKNQYKKLAVISKQMAQDNALAAIKKSAISDY